MGASHIHGDILNRISSDGRFKKYRLSKLPLQMMAFVVSLGILANLVAAASAFSPSLDYGQLWGGVRMADHRVRSAKSQRVTTGTLFLFDKMFEEEGPLGKGITVGKVSVALISEDRGKDSIFGLLEENARWIADDDEAGSLADLAHEVCLSLLRKQASWTAASSASQWFSANDYGKAEAKFNEWSNAEAAKFEKVRVLSSMVTSLQFLVLC